MNKETIAGAKPRELGFNMPSEWAEREGTLMAWPLREAAWLEGLDEARDGYVEVAHAIAEDEKVIMIASGETDSSGYKAAKDARSRLSSTIEVWELPHDDSWLRDNGPTFILNAQGERRAVSWRFNAWGGKYSPYDKDDELAARILERLAVERFDAPLVLEGGSIHVDGEGTLLATEECLLAKNRNPNLSKAEIEELLRDYLGVESFIWLDRGLAGDETDGHVDNVACFVSGSHIAMQVSSDPQNPNYKNSKKNLEILNSALDARGRRIEVTQIEQPPARSCRGEELP
ncbi:hypothetical protein MASR2M78_03230 [Treponema sp.]